MIKQHRKDKLEQAKADAKLQVEQAKILSVLDTDVETTSDNKGTKGSDLGEKSSLKVTKPKEEGEGDGLETTKPRIDNRTKHSEDSSKQNNRSGDPRGRKKAKNKPKESLK